ncbi:unnamed protein product [Pieris macdunnoughi]|uniref:RNB domain-containing protein n=1 Tax=Pieris macdunnoughi TaxID=345717 RepID=A0A821VL02_9NEOP|nr:unnamed protein product [Pieris macdunnoughi]
MGTVTPKDFDDGTLKSETSVQESENASSENNELRDHQKNVEKQETNNDSLLSKKKNARKRSKLHKLKMPDTNNAQKQAIHNESQGYEQKKNMASTSSVDPKIPNRNDNLNIQATKGTNHMHGHYISGNLNNLHISPQQIGHNAKPQCNTQSAESVQDFFIRQVIPLYSNAQYMENLAHHPQFQLTQNVNTPQPGHSSPQMHPKFGYPISVPNSPLVYGSPSFPFQPSNLHSPKYLQNLMQHPLLNYSLKSPNHINNIRNVFPGSSSGHYFNSPQSKNKDGKKDVNNEDRKFESYMSTENVEAGLLQNTLIQGVIRINPKQFQHAYITGTDRSEQDVLIDTVKNRNRALEGDVVIVQILDSDNEENNETNEVKQKKGKVVYIKEKVHTRSCIGSLMLMPDKNRQRALFVPRDYRIPRLNISCTFWPDNFYTDYKRYENTLFLATILEWHDTRFAMGRIVCNIGESGDMQSETKAILAQTDLDVTPFEPDVKHLFPSLDYVIPEEEIKLREDCRKLCIFSIDPSNCRDIDDAVSCRKLDNGNFEVGVHISDVSHFLTENTILDKKVAEKATTIYMVERAYHMLPDELCMLCSLFPGVDKLAFSVFWEITEDAQIQKTRFSKTIIHSCCQLAYEHAQDILDDKEESEASFPEIYNGFKFLDILESLKNLGRISSILRERRFEGGALRIDQLKVSFHLSPTNSLPESFQIYESKQSHQLIEEFMLLANMAVANKIYEDHPKLAFLRCHPEPSNYMLRQLAKALKPMGIDLEINSAGDLYKSLLPYMGPNADKGKATVLSMLCAKPMARAKYFCAGNCEEDFNHYALNVPLYTHFTSPIRRYADIMVHRLLSASLKYRNVPTWDIDFVNMVAAQCNKQKYNAKKAGELSTELYTLKYIEMHSPVFTEAVVVEVKKKYIDVIIVAMGLNRRIFFNNDFPGKYEHIVNEAGSKLSKMELTWNATETLPQVKQVISVFSTLKVEMHKGDDMVKVEVKLVRPDDIAPIL